jgi:hypothetical protein
MTRRDEFARIEVTAIDEGAALLFPDGSTAHVPSDILSRSTVLRQSLSETDGLCVRVDIVKSWLECVEVLKRPVSGQASDPHLLEFLLVWHLAYPLHYGSL